LGDPGCVVAHVGWSPEAGTPAAEAAFERGHLPGAVFVDVDRDLAGSPFVGGPGRHPLPDPEAFAETMSRAGIGDETLVIAYDDADGSLAARLWWMLDATGRPASLIDGGLRAWGEPLESGEAAPREPSHPRMRPWPRERVLSADEVADALTFGSSVLLDARTEERYRGEIEPIDPIPGHVPGAKNVPWRGNVDDEGRFLPPDALRARYESLGVRDAATTIVHCGSGVTTCHALFAMRLAGIGDACLFEGSWSDWVRDSARPVATGSEPGRLS
jgi:thiosulfate/3-mercaptopyruvate sulfurtransferase